MSEIQMGTIQWFPGHMTKTRRMIAANLSLVDAVVEILDARIPSSSQNPEMQRLVKEKPRMLLLNKADMADPNATARWVQYYQKQNLLALPLDCKTGKGIKQFIPMVRNQLLKPLMEKRAKAGIVGAPIRLMIVGIPNVGKSSFINRMAQSKKAKVEDRPGVTRTKQWVKIGDQMELLDMPGVLWPKFDDPEVGKRLAFTGAVKDDVLDIEELACCLMDYLAAHYADTLTERYKIEVEPGDTGYELLEKAGRKRGFLMRGAQVDTERMARILLDEFRAGKLGRFTLETVEN